MDQAMKSEEPGILPSVREPPAGRRFLLGLDVGGTKISGLAMDQEQHVLATVLTATDTASAETTVESIAGAIHKLLAGVNGTPEEILSLGLGIPGQVQNGVAKLAVNLKFEDFPLADRLEHIFRAPVVLENDVRTAALGVYHYFQGLRPVENLAYLSIGTGIAAGLVLHGQLYRGSNGMAGEVGHIVIDPDGPRCNCGSYGCLEAVASGPAIARQAGQAIEAGMETRLVDYQPLRTESVFQAAKAGDEVALRIVQRAGGLLGRAVYALLMAYDVDLLVLGGGVTRAGEALFVPLLAELESLRSHSALADQMLGAGKILPVPEGFDAGAWGAVLLAAVH